MGVIAIVTLYDDQRIRFEYDSVKFGIGADRKEEMIFHKEGDPQGHFTKVPVADMKGGLLIDETTIKEGGDMGQGGILNDE